MESLVKQTDLAEDWRLDPVLHEACYPVVKVGCKDLQAGEARIMTCLMNNIGEEIMTEECEDALIQIQYFVARDFKLDVPLYKHCREEAARLCNHAKKWEDEEDSEKSALVLPCLYR